LAQFLWLFSCRTLAVGPVLRLSCERQGGGAEMWVRAAVVAALLPVATGQIGGDDAISIGARVWLGRLALSLIHTDRTFLTLAL
jgi:hypothetical protein